MWSFGINVMISYPNTQPVECLSLCVLLPVLFPAKHRSGFKTRRFALSFYVRRSFFAVDGHQHTDSLQAMPHFLACAKIGFLPDITVAVNNGAPFSFHPSEEG